MLKHIHTVLALAGAVALSLVAFAGGLANVELFATSPQTQSPPAQSGQSTPAMAEMMKQHQQMMADMKAADAKLDELVNAMNAATGEAKVSALAQVVSELVRQQKTMHEHLGTMDQQMMMRMMGGRGMMRGR
jgi:hypothetical protein